MLNKKRIVITGLGPIASPGIGKRLLWKGLLKNNLNIELVKEKIGNKVWEEYYIHQVKKFDLNSFGLRAADLNYLHYWKEGRDNKDLNYLLAATKLALDDGKINYKVESNGLGLIVTHENPCLEQLLSEIFEQSYKLSTKPNKNKKDFFEDLFESTVKTAYETQSFMYLFHIARIFNIHDFSLYINNACSSGLFAIETARDLICSGKVNKVLVVGGDCPNIFKYLWFKKLNMYSMDGLAKPFSRTSNGFVFGEGASALLIEDYESAQQRKAKVYVEILGSGHKLESWKVTVPNITKRYLEECILIAIRRSGLKSKDIDLICAHGTGTWNSDYLEMNTISNVFGSIFTPITSLKPLIGHNLGGCTIIEIIILILSMQKKIIPPLLTSNINNEFKLNFVTSWKKSKVNIVLKICSAFAGYNSAMIFKRIEKN